MLAKVRSCATVGLEGYIVEVEVDYAQGLASFAIVGLPDTAVKESAERVRSAVRNSGFVFPTQRLTVNLAPADLRKVGPAYDLPIAVGVLIATGQVMAKRFGGHPSAGRAGAGRHGAARSRRAADDCVCARPRRQARVRARSRRA